MAKKFNFKTFYKNLSKEILETRLEKLSKRKLHIYKPLRIVFFALKGFNEDLIQLRASALTFYSMLSIVPVLAMIFGIAKGFGFEKNLEAELMGSFKGYEDVVAQVMGFVQKMIDNTKGGLIAGVGLAVLIWTIINVLSSVEKSFNDIWKIQKSRPLMRKFSDYLSIMLIAPILIFLSSSLTVYIGSFLSTLSEKQSLEILGAFLNYTMNFIPFFLIFVLFTFIYFTLPNTKVKISSAMLAGIIAGTTFQFLQWGYIYIQMSLSHYNTIYGSFAALPLLLFWMRISWLIVLFGAEVSFAHQNIFTYEFEISSSKISPYYKRLIWLRIANLLFKNFKNGKPAMTSTQISFELEIPVGLTRVVVGEMCETGILSQTLTQQERESAYQPAKDINQIFIADIIKAIDNYGKDKLSIIESEEIKKLRLCLDKFSNQNYDSEDNILLKDI